MELALDLKPPFQIKDQAGLKVTGLLDTADLGTRIYRVNLFGWLPLTEVVVDVVPLVRVYPGGQSIGVLLSSGGLVVSELGGVLALDGTERFPAKEGGIEPGDVLLSIEGHRLHRPEQVSQLINSLAEDKRLLKMVVQRDNRKLTLEVEPIQTRQTNVFGQSSLTYLLGVFLEDPAAGVGTLSFYDAQTGRFGA